MILIDIEQLPELTPEKILEVFNQSGLWYIPNVQQVYATKDNDGHWYVLPVDLKDQFFIDLENEEMVDSGEFGSKYDQYRTGGDLNCIQLYAHIKPESVI